MLGLELDHEAEFDDEAEPELIMEWLDLEAAEVEAAVLAPLEPEPEPSSAQQLLEAQDEAEQARELLACMRAATKDTSVSIFVCACVHTHMGIFTYI